MSRDHVLDGHILNLIQTQDISEQLDLQDKLKKRGFAIPQATLSRRLKKLQIAKVAGIYRMIGAHMPHLPLVLNIQVSDFGMIVLHTHPGNANSLASYFDRKYVALSKQQHVSGILGTLAGDDTVLLIIKSKSHMKDALHSIQKDFPYLTIC